MQGTWVRSLGWEDPLEKGKATHSSILAWRIPWTIYYIVHGFAKSRTPLSDFHFIFIILAIIIFSSLLAFYLLVFLSPGLWVSSAGFPGVCYLWGCSQCGLHSGNDFDFLFFPRCCYSWCCVSRLHRVLPLLWASLLPWQLLLSTFMSSQPHLSHGNIFMFWEFSLCYSF